MHNPRAPLYAENRIPACGQEDKEKPQMSQIYADKNESLGSKRGDSNGVCLFIDLRTSVTSAVSLRCFDEKGLTA
jgi:hypothetical protein